MCRRPSNRLRSSNRWFFYLRRQKVNVLLRSGTKEVPGPFFILGGHGGPFQDLELVELRSKEEAPLRREDPLSDLTVDLHVGINLVTFLLYGVDKWKARKGRWQPQLAIP